MRTPSELTSIEPTIFDRQVSTDYPQPIASAWLRVFNAKDQNAKLQQAHITFLEVLARTLTCYLLPEYLSGPTNDDVEETLSSKGLEKAAVGTWWALIRQLIAANGSRSNQFFVHAFPWYFNGDKPSEAARIIEDLCALRNDMSHGVQPISALSIQNRLSDALAKYRRLLFSLNWLCGYPLFRADLNSERSDGAKQGHIQAFRGSQLRPPYELAQWRAFFASDFVYVHHPDNGVLMVSPFIQTVCSVESEPRLHVLSKAGRRGPMILSDDDGHTTDAVYEGVKVSIADVLKDRQLYRWLQLNEPEGALSTAVNPSRLPCRVERMLGRGALTTSFVVLDAASNALRVLKVPRPMMAASVEFRERFFETGKHVGRDEHPNVAGVEVRVDSESGPYALMDLMPATMSGKISLGGINSEEKLLLCAEEALSALVHIHDKGIVHGAIKPTNIFFDSDDRLVLGEFGLTVDAADDFVTRLIQKVQQQDYAAPEQQRGRLTAKSDVFSLARTLHDLWKGSLSNTLPGTEVEGWVGQLLRIMGDRFPERRLDARQALEMVRTRRQHLTPPPEDISIEQVESPRAMGRTMRGLLERGARLASPLSERLREIRTGSGTTALNVWETLRQNHLRTAWPHVLGNLTLGDVLSASGLRFSTYHIYSEVLRLPLDEQQESLMYAAFNAQFPHIERAEVYDQIPAAAIGLPKLVESLGAPTIESIDERRFLQESLCSVGEETSEASDPLSQLWEQLERAIPHPRYSRVGLRKRSGGVRWVHIPNPSLATIQRRIGKIITAYSPNDAASVGFVPQRSTALHARYHEGAAAAVIVDIHDFFGSITLKQILNVFPPADPLSDRKVGWRWRNPFAAWERSGLYMLGMLVVNSHQSRHHPFLPQGAPSSPPLANLVAQKLDHIIRASIASLHGASDWTYSRYADDLVISSRSGGHSFHVRAQKVLVKAAKRMQWVISEKKIRHWSSLRGGPLTLCGIQVPSGRGLPLELPRDTKRRVRAALHAISKGTVTASGRGILGFAYATTGNHGLVAVLPGPTQRAIRELGRALYQEGSNDFLAGWLDE